MLEHIDRHLDRTVELAELAAVAHFSPFHFHRLFTAWMGETLGDYQRRRRLEMAAMRLVAQPASPVLDIALSVGFGSAEAFARAFKARYGCTATAWRQSEAEQASEIVSLHATKPAGIGEGGFALLTEAQAPAVRSMLNFGVGSDPQARAYVSGVAWHCYAGNPAVMDQVHRAWPDKEVFFSECSGGNWAPDWGGSLGWMTDNLIIAPTRAGSKGTILWNLALDENHGPHRGGCGDCRGVVTIDSRTGAVTRNVEYYVLGHASRFVRPGARRIASEGGPSGLTHAAFRNPDGSLVLLAHNASTAALRLDVRSSGRAFSLTMPAGEVMTVVWADGTTAP